MYKKVLGLSLLLASSSTVMADSVYSIEPTETKTHHEATSGGIGLVIGTVAGGPLGAIIGGSMGVMAGNQQTKTEIIAQQKQSILALENELSLTMTQLSQSKKDNEASLTQIKTLENEQQHAQQQHRAESIHFANSYQFDIYFMTNSNVITAHSQKGLIKLAELLKNNQHFYANIEAHSDWRGSNDANCILAKQRLSAVTEQLVDAGSQSEQLLATSYGEHANINQGSWGDELFYDRRVTITLNYFE
ncbi:MAG: OmpA family protein [Gammaproteobacteria bacterium]|nr:OmpA family protein [Gammaproteobacteria bacterium]